MPAKDMLDTCSTQLHRGSALYTHLRPAGPEPQLPVFCLISVQDLLPLAHPASFVALLLLRV